ncbi:hypothetical protein OYT1_ch1255 [Ferriphaselus amnicola]|uniref:DUF6900 domain-containing protein n=1 Tax=Ferriphaselus amnicola TaxID=1188319 RepID=A0A2Z6GBQ2_9PROT|nr:hypothetical protein [Ferriphaselus amnicola]BBE50812.1 hypothetical protein OYT1_ch1255 [Ferriphaselus amnicola]
MNQLDTILTLIAEMHLDIETLETRHSDRLDFHDVAVWRIKEALHAAFMAGCEVGLQTPKASEAEIAAQP